LKISGTSGPVGHNHQVDLFLMTVKMSLQSADCFFLSLKEKEKTMVENHIRSFSRSEKDELIQKLSIENIKGIITRLHGFPLLVALKTYVYVQNLLNEGSERPYQYEIDSQKSLETREPWCFYILFKNDHPLEAFDHINQFEDQSISDETFIRESIVNLTDFFFLSKPFDFVKYCEILNVFKNKTEKKEDEPHMQQAREYIAKYLADSVSSYVIICGIRKLIALNKITYRQFFAIVRALEENNVQDVDSTEIVAEG